jgi:carbonic anhydrase
MQFNFQTEKLLSKKIVVIAAFLISLIAVLPTLAIAGESTPKWGYGGAGNPTMWGRINPDYAICELGQNQSPINIDNVQQPKNSANIEFNYHPTLLSVVNNGHTIQVNYQSGSSIKIRGEKYELLQFHFHTPSEHTIKGKASALELHLVHRNKKGELAVIGVMLEQGKANPVIEQIWQEISQEANNEQSKITINAANLLPTQKAFLSYTGSLTTPPCSENVKWNLFVEPIELSKEQITNFQHFYQVNARPVQPINTRIVEFYP